MRERRARKGLVLLLILMLLTSMHTAVFAMETTDDAGFVETNPLTVPAEGLDIENGTLKGIKADWMQLVNPDDKPMYVTVSIPESVTAVGNNALRGSDRVNIVSLDFSQAVNLISIGNQAALHNHALRGVVDLSATKVETIGKLAFSDCPNLTGVILPQTLKALGNQTEDSGSVFSDCSGMEFIRTAEDAADMVFALPKGLTYIGRQTFKNCFATGTDARLKLPASVETIGNEAFYSKQISQIIVEKQGDGWNPKLQGYSVTAFKTGNSNTVIVFKDTKSYNDYVLGRSFSSAVKNTLTYPFEVSFVMPSNQVLKMKKLNYQSLRYTKNPTTGFWEKDMDFSLPEISEASEQKPGYEYYWTFNGEKITPDYKFNINYNPQVRVGYALQQPVIRYTVNGMEQENRYVSVELVDGTPATAGVKVHHPLLKSESGTDETYVFFRYAWWDEVTVVQEDHTAVSTINGPRSEAEPALFSHAEDGTFLRTLTDKAEIPIVEKGHARENSDQYLVEVYGYIVENGGEPKLFYKSHHNTIDFGSDHDTEATVKDVYTMQVGVTNAFSVTFDGNGGTWEAEESDTKRVTVQEGEEITVPEAPKRSGYTFKGWNDGEADYQPGDTCVVTETMYLYAQWKRNFVPGIDPEEPEEPKPPIDIDDPDVPKEEEPTEPEQPKPPIDIDDPDIPKDEKPDAVIDAPDVPKGAAPDDTAAPKTGDAAASLWIYLCICVLAGAALICTVTSLPHKSKRLQLRDR